MQRKIKKHIRQKDWELLRWMWLSYVLPAGGICEKLRKLLWRELSAVRKIKKDWQMRRRCVIFSIYRLWRRVSRSGSVWKERKCRRLEAFLQTPHLNFNAGAFREKRLFAVLSGTWRCVKAQKERRVFLRIRVVPRVFLVPLRTGFLFL